jgi:hypothetical protein
MNENVDIRSMLTAEQVAARTCRTIATVRRWARQGLKHTRVGGPRGQMYFDWNDVSEWMRQFNAV